MAVPALVYWEDPVTSGAVFGTVLVALVSLASCSLITVASYTCLTLLTAVLAVKLYSFVMVKAGKAEAGSDPLAKVPHLSPLTCILQGDFLTGHVNIFRYGKLPLI